MAEADFAKYAEVSGDRIRPCEILSTGGLGSFQAGLWLEQAIGKSYDLIRKNSWHQTRETVSAVVGDAGEVAGANSIFDSDVEAPIGPKQVPAAPQEF